MKFRSVLAGSNMKKLISIAALAATVAGCAAPQEVCGNMGYTPGTGLYLHCVNSVVAQRQRASEALMVYGAQIQQMGQPRYPTYTTCNRFGYSITCNSW